MADQQQQQQQQQQQYEPLHGDMPQPSSSQPQQHSDARHQYFAEESFGGVQATARVYTGPFLGVSFMSIIGCFVMASVVKRSPNLSFQWLQRRVGAQFMTFAYFFTTNILYYHDGKRWRTRDVHKLAKRAMGPLWLQMERRRRAKEAADKVTGGLAAATAAAAAAGGSGSSS